MRRKNTNSPIALLITLALWAGAFLIAGWTGLGIAVSAFVWGAFGTVWNGLRAGGIRPRSEWAQHGPVNWRNWHV